MKRKADDDEPSSRPAKKQAAHEEAHDETKSLFREGLFDQVTLEEQKKRYSGSDP